MRSPSFDQTGLPNILGSDPGLSCSARALLLVSVSVACCEKTTVTVLNALGIKGA